MKAQGYSFAYQTHSERVMGKYLLAWVLGVPAVVLVGIYLITHIL
jgi:hypothetical protein